MSHMKGSKAADVQFFSRNDLLLISKGRKRPMFDFCLDLIYESDEGVESGRCIYLRIRVRE